MPHVCNVRLSWFEYCLLQEPKYKTSKMSNVLNHFVIPLNSVGNVVGKCKHCKIDIKGHMKTTSNFFKHLKVIMIFFTMVALMLLI